MLNRLVQRVSPGLVVSMLALFVALGGVGAFALKGKNSVDSGDIKKNAVTGSDIKKSAVASSDIKDGVVSGTDVADDSLTGDDIDEGTLADPQTRFSVRMAVAATPVDVATVGPFTISARCLAGPDVELFVRTTENDSYVNGDDNDEPDLDIGEEVIPVELDDEDDQFNGAAPSGATFVANAGGTEVAPIGGSACSAWGEVTRTDQG
jgi:hypothetical protein